MLIARVFVLVCMLASTLAQAGTVTTELGFSTYRGPLGTFAESLNAPLSTFFVVNGRTPVLALPTPFSSGIAAGDPRAGTGVVDLNAGLAAPDHATSLEFYFGYFGDATGLGFVHNLITFTPTVTPGLSVGSVFKLGTFNFTNGNWLVGDGTNNIPSQISFIVRATSSQADLNNHFWTDSLVYTNVSVGGGTAAQNADMFSFLNNPSLGSLAVNDGGTGSVDVMGRIGSLIPLYLANPTGDAFIVGGVPAVPEPASYAMLFIGLGFVSLAMKCRDRRRSRVLTTKVG